MEPGYTYSIETHTEYLSDTGYFLINFTTEKKNLEKVLKAVYENFDRLKNEPVKKLDLDHAKGFFSGQLKINTETTYDLSMFYSSQVFSNSDEIISLGRKIAKINRVDTKAILRAARKYFQPKNFYLTAVGNTEKLKITLY